jgi:hypothetical protein
MNSNTTEVPPSSAQNFQPQKSRIFTFLKKNSLFLCAVLLVLFFFFILYLSASSSNDTSKKTGDQNATLNLPTSVPSIFPTPHPKKTITSYEQENSWSPEHLSQIDFGDTVVSSSPQSDGITLYSYTSSKANRPNLLFVKDDIVIAKRTVITQKYIYNYTNTMAAPDYTFIGSNFYGPDTTTYVYLNKGVAFVADANSTMVKEQLIFQPTSLEDFKNKYGGDVVSFTVVPTLSEE